MSDIYGQTAIITGGGTGIGRGIALALAREGAKVVVCGRRPAPLEEVVKTIQDNGATALAFQVDVAQEADVEHLINATLAQFERIDILINNAGISGGGFIHKHSIEEWDRIMAVNLRGPFLLARAVLPHMRQRQSGHIINIGSESGFEHYQGDGAYGVAKHALNALGEYIQQENQEHNIRVNTICPGMVVTEMTENLPGLNLDDCLTPEDIADLTMWLLSRRPNVKIGRPILIQTVVNPWQ